MEQPGRGPDNGLDFRITTSWQFYRDQITRLEGLDDRYIKLIHIHVMRLKMSKKRVVPRIYVFISFNVGIDDFTSYQPFEISNMENTIVKRRGIRAERFVGNMNYQKMAYYDILKFLMQCGYLGTIIDKIQLTVDSDPLIKTRRLGPHSNGHGVDAFRPYFRRLFLRLKNPKLWIVSVVIDSRFRPLWETLNEVQFARCTEVETRRLEFGDDNIREVQETIGVFGLTSPVCQWAIQTSHSFIDQTTFQIFGFVKYVFYDDAVLLTSSLVVLLTRRIVFIKWGAMAKDLSHYDQWPGMNGFISNYYNHIFNYCAEKEQECEKPPLYLDLRKNGNQNDSNSKNQQSSGENGSKKGKNSEKDSDATLKKRQNPDEEDSEPLLDPNNLQIASNRIVEDLSELPEEPLSPSSMQDSHRRFNERNTMRRDTPPDIRERENQDSPSTSDSESDSPTNSESSSSPKSSNKSSEVL